MAGGRATPGAIADARERRLFLYRSGSMETCVFGQGFLETASYRTRETCTLGLEMAILQAAMAAPPPLIASFNSL